MPLSFSRTTANTSVVAPSLLLYLLHSSQGNLLFKKCILCFLLSCFKAFSGFSICFFVKPSLPIWPTKAPCVMGPAYLSHFTSRWSPSLPAPHSKPLVVSFQFLKNNKLFTAPKPTHVWFLSFLEHCPQLFSWSWSLYQSDFSSPSLQHSCLTHNGSSNKYSLSD